MTMFAGVFSRTGKPVPESTCSELHEFISRDARDPRVVFRDRRVYLVKVDSGAYGEPAFRIDAATGSVAILAGDALLSSGSKVRGRAADLECLQSRLDSSDYGCLELSKGIFALAHYDPRSARLTLATDKIGLRPVYCWFGDDYVVFATALRTLEAVKLVRKTVDLVGITEMCMYPRFPANDRTPYSEIKRLRPATAVTIADGAVRNNSYFDWRKPAHEKTRDANEALSATHDIFLTAIKRRLKGDSFAPACLSGGLDSRCVVAGLRSVGADVGTFTFYALPNSAERLFAAEFAVTAGTLHTEIQSLSWDGGTTFEQRISQAWQERLKLSGRTATRPNLLWTGDGGSVVLGHVFLEPSKVADLRRGHPEKALIALRGRLTPTILRSTWARDVADQMLADFRDQMNWAACEDPARAYHLYLILNEQRDDFREHFENIDLHRLEFNSPFYDPDFVASILSLPIDDCIQHKFYHKWLRLLPHAASVPWQAYPEHEPCPLPLPGALAVQWGSTSDCVRRSAIKSKLVRESFRAFTDGKFPQAVLSPTRAFASAMLHWTGLRDCQAALNSLAIYKRYWDSASGRMPDNATETI